MRLPQAREGNGRGCVSFKRGGREEKVVTHSPAYCDIHRGRWLAAPARTVILNSSYLKGADSHPEFWDKGDETETRGFQG